MRTTFSINRAILAMALAAASVMAFQLPAAAGNELPPPEQRKVMAPGEGVNANPNADQRVNSPLGPTLYYRMIPGTAFATRGTSEGYTHAGAGCVRRTQTGDNGDALFSYFLDLPDQATIKYLRTYVSSAAPGNYSAASYVTKYDSAGNIMDVQAYGIGSGVGYFNVIGNEITETMDTYVNSYVLQFFVNSTSYSLCGMRVAYYMPVVYAAYLPMLMR